ncbi:MAG: hypothetical protein LBR98_07130 [Syntrophomonadaceae bacterium]|jgi:preprotein translocase subunit SecD|nr:hypothetical protein [Syntrophomonadaceae bacterium]
MKKTGKPIGLSIIIAAILIAATACQGKAPSTMDYAYNFSIIYQAGIATPTSADMDIAVSILQSRIDKEKIMNPAVYKEGTDQIVVKGVSQDNVNLNEIASSLAKTALLSFRDESGNTLLTGADIKKVKAEKAVIDDSGYQISIEFSKDGSKKFAEATSNNIGKRISIFLDDEVMSDPYVSMVITDGKCAITGSYTKESAEDLERLLKVGTLPFSLIIISVDDKSTQ